MYMYSQVYVFVRASVLGILLESHDYKLEAPYTPLPIRIGELYSKYQWEHHM